MASQGLTSANTVVKPTGAETPADALGDPSMNDLAVESQEFAESSHRDPDVLRELLVERGLTQTEAADVLGIEQVTVSKWKSRHGICVEDNKRHCDPEWLRKKYHDEGLTMTEIAEGTEVSEQGIHYRMEKYGIERRRPSDSQTDGDLDKLRSKSWLRKEYVENSKGMLTIAEELGVAEVTVRRWLNQHGIEPRRAGVPGGENHPDWKGGVEEYYGPDWREQRKKALERDGYKCLVCGCSQSEHKSEYDQSLEVHHIRPIRTFDDPEDANELDNLVTLCSRCHHKWEGIPLRPEVVGDE